MGSAEGFTGSASIWDPDFTLLPDLEIGQLPRFNRRESTRELFGENSIEDSKLSSRPHIGYELSLHQAHIATQSLRIDTEELQIETRLHINWARRTSAISFLVFC